MIGSMTVRTNFAANNVSNVAARRATLSLGIYPRHTIMGKTQIYQYTNAMAILTSLLGASMLRVYPLHSYYEKTRPSIDIHTLWTYPRP